MKKLGIIGGMGPKATAQLFDRVISLTDAPTDQDHIPIIVFDDPSIPDRTAHLLDPKEKPDFAASLVKNAQVLESLGCDVLAMPCNTAHGKADVVAASLTTARLLHMPESAAAEAAKASSGPCGILATDGTIETGLYDSILEKRGITPVHPSPAAQESVMSIIYDHVKAGTEPPAALLDEVFADLETLGCATAILGCTELSVLDIPTEVRGIRVIDALDVLAAACVVACGARLKTDA